MENIYTLRGVEFRVNGEEDRRKLMEEARALYTQIADDWYRAVIRELDARKEPTKA